MRKEWTHFWIDGKEYEAPDIWLAVQVNKRTDAGLSIQEACLGAMRYWAEQTDLMETAQ